MMKNGRHLTKYIASLLLFGTNGVVASMIALSSYEIVLTRTLIGGLLLVMIFVLTRQNAQLLKDKKHPLFMLLSGLAMGANWMFLYEAYRHIGVGIATLLNYCGPVIVMVLAPIIFREKLTWAKAAGFLTVLAGMFFINMQVLSEGKTAWGVFCGLMSAVMYAVMVIFNKKARSITGLENSMWQLVVSFLMVTVFVLLKQGLAIHIDPGSVVPILILGLVNTGAGCYFYFSSIGKLPVQTVAVCGYLEPLSAVLFSALFLGEHMTAVQIIGGILILGGAAFGELRPRQRTPEEV